MNKIILIGGAPGVGKSTLAKKIAQVRGVNWISTDQIRSIMQAATTEAIKPELFVNAKSTNDPKEAASLEIQKAESVWQGVKQFIENIYPWEGCVIEGTAILPRLVARDFNNREDVQSIFIVQSVESINEVIEQRSKDPWINTKTPQQKKKKTEQTVILNEIIKKEAADYNCKIYDLDGFKNGYDEVVKDYQT